MTDPGRRRAERLDFRDLGIPPGPEHPCPYLEDRVARERAFGLSDCPQGLYKHLMDYGWRRSGRIVYKPACVNCSACVPIRVPVNDFKPSRIHRRITRQNEAIETTVDSPKASDEKFDLFVRYQKARHTGDMCTQRDQFEQFLYESPVASVELEFRLDGKLIGASIVDRDGDALSAVYTWFEPDLSDRSIGTWAILRSIGFAKECEIPYYYMGYFIEDCRKMNYKIAFKPFELGDSEGEWKKEANG